MDQANTDENNKTKNKIDYTTPSPRFSVKTDDELDRGIDYLNKNGYVVFSDVINQDEINTNKDLLWNFLESASNGTLRRDDPSTWSNLWPSYHPTLGIVNGCGIGQSDFLWNVRSNRKIKRIFARIWNTSQLLVSFDGCGIFRDWRYDPTWKTIAGWSHVDQNPKLKPGPCCFQGLAAFTDQNEKTGGLLVYPRSYLYFNEVVHMTTESNDFVLVPNPSALSNNDEILGRLVHCRAGDFIVWDSRTVHCNIPATAIEELPRKEPPELLRIVAYVSMSPTSFVNGQTLEEFREKRKQLVENNNTLTHWSHEFVISSGVQTDLPKVSLDKFTPYQKALIFGYDDDDNNSNNV